MKKSLAELSKEIKFIKEKIERLYLQELRTCTSTERRLQSGKIVKNNSGSTYNYKQYRDEIQQLMKTESTYKSILNKYYSTEIVEEYSLTISDCIVRLGQLKKELKHFLSMSESFTDYYSEDLNECSVIKVYNYDLNETKRVYDKLYEEMIQLQFNIDKKNIQTIIDI